MKQRLTRDFRTDDHVRLHPATNLWMRGAKSGTVTKVGRKYVTVRTFPDDGVHRVHPNNIEVEG